MNVKEENFCIVPFVQLNTRGKGDARVCCSTVYIRLKHRIAQEFGCDTPESIHGLVRVRVAGVGKPRPRKVPPVPPPTRPARPQRKDHHASTRNVHVPQVQLWALAVPSVPILALRLQPFRLSARCNSPTTVHGLMILDAGGAFASQECVLTPHAARSHTPVLSLV